MGIYVSGDLKANYGPAIEHLSSSLSGYKGVGILSEKDIAELRRMSSAKGPEPQNTMLTQLVERMFPGQSAELLKDPKNRESMKEVLKSLARDATRESDGQSVAANLIINGKPVQMGFVYAPANPKTTAQNMVNNQISGKPREDSDPEFKRQQLRDAGIYILTHELGHLVQFKEQNKFPYDETKKPPWTPPNLADTSEEEYADNFAVSHMGQLAIAGIISNANIGREFTCARIVDGVSQMVANKGKPSIDHVTGFMDDTARLSEAAARINALWHARNQKNTPENMYAFMQDLKKRDDVSADVRHIANTYLSAVNDLMLGRVVDGPATKMAKVMNPIDPIVIKGNEPVIAHKDTETAMTVKGMPMTDFFAGKAEGQSVQLANVATVKIAPKIDVGLVPS